MTTTAKLKAPFPYFGGKSRVASLIWQRLGDPDNVIEPFAGSAAFLLARPHPPRVETLNDMDCYVANFWRATSVDPEAVAVAADWPVNEADLHARHRWLVLSDEAAEFRKAMRQDPSHFDARIAGWWCWGMCCWIGSGWCSHPEWEQKPFLGQGSHAGKEQDRGVNRGLGEQMPKLGHGVRTKQPGCGIHGAPVLSQQVPVVVKRVKTGGMGINANGPSDSHRPQLADAFSRGRGVNGNDSAGTCDARRAWLLDWFGRLRDRLRTVRVCCGEWLRVCDSPSVTTRLGFTGIFLDPPYAKTRTDGSVNRSGQLYANDGSQDVDSLVSDVRAYCLERGPDPMMRIALCGYEGEGHEELIAAGWDVVAWKAAGGYGSRSATGKENAARERIWFSPHCVRPNQDTPLFKD